VRTVAEYLERAAEFEALAAATSIDTLKKRYFDIAACYRLLAKEREWLTSTSHRWQRASRADKWNIATSEA
jgi:hypothetical protein